MFGPVWSGSSNSVSSKCSEIRNAMQREFDLKFKAGMNRGAAAAAAEAAAAAAANHTLPGIFLCRNSPKKGTRIIYNVVIKPAFPTDVCRIPYC